MHLSRDTLNFAFTLSAFQTNFANFCLYLIHKFRQLTCLVTIVVVYKR